MIYEYDRSLVSKFEKVMPGRVIYAPADKFYERYLLADNNDKVKLPALSVWREQIGLDKTGSLTPLRIQNVRYPDNEKFTAEQVFSIPLSIDYKLEMWTATDTDRDDLLKEMLYFLNLYPYLEMSYRNHKFTFPIVIGDVTDSSDISSFENTGDIYRMTVPLQVPDARILYFSNIDTLKHIDLSFFVNNQKD